MIIEDVDRDTRFPEFRAWALSESVHAVHSTPLIGKDGQVLGALSAHLPRARKPTERELRIADICARKASVFVERARAEELVREHDRRFQSVLEAAGVPFMIFSPVRDADGRIRRLPLPVLQHCRGRSDAGEDWRTSSAGKCSR